MNTNQSSPEQAKDQSIIELNIGLKDDVQSLYFALDNYRDSLVEESIESLAEGEYEAYLTTQHEISSVGDMLRQLTILAFSQLSTFVDAQRTPKDKSVTQQAREEQIEKLRLQFGKRYK